ncbi:hypothetical protein HGA92_03805 [Candidatus Gracilibacteria bacterium]|nr:hypothetical protein [Candidatus Gracilibacteria bacterium]NUJ99223.1 hypothetical protein [Candidatus Gracilibacteria bacterium]
MIYLFTGNNSFALTEEIKKWKKVFLEKYGDFNLVHIKDILLFDTHFLVENIVGSSLFGGKKLIIIEDYPFSPEVKEDNSEKEIFFLDILDKIPEENIVVFAVANPDKRTKIYKKIQELAQVKDFSFDDENDLKKFILKRYEGKIGNFELDVLIRYKSANIQKIIADIEKLLLTKEKITKDDIEKNIVPEIEENIFMIVDNLLNKRKDIVLKEIKNTLNFISIYALYNSLLGNIRNRLYIDMFKSLHFSPSEIKDYLGLGNKAFLIGKVYQIQFDELKKLYLDMIELDKKMKFGKMIGSEEVDFLYEIEKIIIKDL